MTLSPGANLPLRLLLVLLALAGPVLGDPLYRSLGEAKPLLYMRLPLPWTKPGLFTPLQQEKIVEGLLLPVTPRNDFGQSLRDLAKVMDGSIEVLLQEMSASSLVPGMMARGRHRGQPQVVIEHLKRLYISSFSLATGQKVDWIKFQQTEADGWQVAKTPFFGLVWIAASKDEYILKYEGNLKAVFNPATPPLPVQGALDRIEAANRTEPGDFLFCFFPQSVMSAAQALEKYINLKSLFEPLGMPDMDHLELFTQGSGEKFSLSCNLVWKGSASGFWSKMRAADKARSTRIPGSGFNGLLNVGDLDDKAFASFMTAVFPAQEPKIPAYQRLYKTMSPLALSFSWPDGLMAPALFLRLNHPEKFEKELKNILSPYVQFTRELREPHVRTHIMWNKSTLTYELQKDRLVFTPLIHALQDFDGRTEQVDAGHMVDVSFPLAGSSSGCYYSFLHLLFQAYVAGGNSVDPNHFPAFRDSGLKPFNWQGTASLVADNTAEKFSARLALPYGLPGLLAGVNANSSMMLNFVSLLSLSLSSI